MAKKNEKEQAQTNFPLFYENPTPLNATQFEDKSLKKDFGQKFAKDTNAVPINMIEMPQISNYYPIAFSADESASPVAIVGLRDGENLFVDAKNQWNADTIPPAYVRRYPFIFTQSPDNENFILCVDDTKGVVEKSTKQPFYNEDKTPSPLSESALKFCTQFHNSMQQTQAFSKDLQESGLLVERNVQISIADGKKISFSGFRMIDDTKLSELDDKTFLAWREKGWLPFIYAHLFSSTQWRRLSLLLNERIAKESAK